MVRQLQKFKNKTEGDLVVYVEFAPDRYVLPPGKWMQIEYDHSGEAGEYGLEIVLENKKQLQLRIFLEEWDTAVVTIDGRVTEPWEDYVPPAAPGKS